MYIIHTCGMHNMGRAIFGFAIPFEIVAYCLTGILVLLYHVYM